MVNPISLLSEVAYELFISNVVHPRGVPVKVGRTPSLGLRIAEFEIEGHKLKVLEQNPAKPSPTGQLAREGHKVAWLLEGGRYLAKSVDGRAELCHGAPPTLGERCNKK